MRGVGGGGGGEPWRHEPNHSHTVARGDAYNFTRHSGPLLHAVDSELELSGCIGSGRIRLSHDEG